MGLFPGGPVKRGDQAKGKPPGLKAFLIKAALVVAVGLIAIFRPDIPPAVFTFSLIGPVKVYHVFWALAVSILVKRMIPRFNKKISSRKIFGRFYRQAENITPKRDEQLRSLKARTDRGA